ncbi:MAG: polyprenyl synthetase family protein [Actinomycetota bacterium]|nr:polyprenyl synthetase family protein [Actinomycetota bacterium]
MTPTIAVGDVLKRAREMTEPRLAEALERLPASIQRAASYHIGWTEADGQPRHQRGGKFVRAALAILSAEATWADAEVGLPGAVAVELVHNFSLLHDDLMDGDLERRHRPTVWALWGPSLALLAGDALATLSVQVLLGTGSPEAPAAASALSRATAEMIAGQADDLAFEQRRNVSVEECMGMSTAKTGALLGCAASIGAVLAGAPPATARALEGFGRHLGVAFQAVDDLLGIWGDPATTGKPAGNDIRQRKKSMPIVAALAAGDDESRELDALLFGEDVKGSAGEAVAGDGSKSNGHVVSKAGMPGIELATPEWAPAQLRPLSADEVARAASLVERCGGREWTAARAKAHLDAALGSLERARLSALPRRALADLAVYVVERES